MVPSRRSYILFCFFSFLLVACKPTPEPVTAGPRFNVTPGVADSKALVYEDTSSAYYQEIIQRLDAFYAAQVRAGFNGSVLIAQKGKIIYERYFGLANREQGLRLGPNIPSQLASTSKTFTGAATLYLYQNKYLDINAPVQHYLPEFPYAGITIKMLLNHRSGIPDYQKWSTPYVRNENTLINNNDVLQIFSQYKPSLEFRPNTRFKYCNSNYAILASIIERVTELPFADFMQRYIFQPLGMANTFVYTPFRAWPANAAQTYKYNWQRWPSNFADGVVGDKNVYSTVRDLYRWDQSFYQGKLLNNQTLQLAYAPYSFERPGVKNYGLGWRMLNFPSGNKIIYHNGWWHGNNTVFYRFIKENMTVVILGNKYNGGIYKQAKVLYSIVKNVPMDEGFDGEE